MTKYDITTWNPYEDFDVNSIQEPPCRVCKHFKPEIDNRKGKDNRLLFMGVKICQTPKDMFQDFSCFEPREGE